MRLKHKKRGYVKNVYSSKKIINNSKIYTVELAKTTLHKDITESKRIYNKKTRQISNRPRG